MKIGPMDLASVISGPPHLSHNNTTCMQYETKMYTGAKNGSKNSLW